MTCNFSSSDFLISDLNSFFLFGEIGCLPVIFVLMGWVRLPCGGTCSKPFIGLSFNADVHAVYFCPFIFKQ